MKINREKFLTFLPLIIIFAIAIVFFMSIGSSNYYNIDDSKNNQDENEKLYICDERNLEMACDSLSKINRKNTQTRCYFYDEKLTYKICDKGWRLKV